MKKESVFWLHEIDLEDIYKELLKKGGENTSFWDIFKSYEPDSKLRNEDPEWIREQDSIVEKIVADCFANMSLNGEEIDNIVVLLQELAQPEESRSLEDVDCTHLDLIEKIYSTYFNDFESDEDKLFELLYALEEKLTLINRDHIIKEELKGEKKIIHEQVKLGKLSKQQGEMILESLEKEMLADYIEYEEDFEVESYGFDYPRFPVAFSNTFFGFDDAGNLSYEEQEKVAQKKFHEYVQKLNDLLGLKSEQSLMPESLNLQTAEWEDHWDEYYGFMEVHPFCFNFDDAFKIWKNEDKVLFLFMSKEDKELPYEIFLGGLTLSQYNELLSSYNAMVVNIKAKLS